MLSADAGVPPRQRVSFTCLPMSSSQRIWSLLRVFQPVAASVSFHFFGELSTQSSNNASLHGQWKILSTYSLMGFSHFKCLFSSRISQHVDSLRYSEKDPNGHPFPFLTGNTHGFTKGARFFKRDRTDPPPAGSTSKWVNDSC